MRVFIVFGFAIWRRSLYKPKLIYAIHARLIEIWKGGHYVFESTNRRTDHR